MLSKTIVATGMAAAMLSGTAISPYYRAQLAQAHAETAAVQAQHARDLKAISDAALAAAHEQVRAVNEVRAEEQRRINEQTEIAHEAHKQAETARAHARAADAAAGRLRERVAELAAAGCAASNSAATGAGPAADGPSYLLADVLIESVERNKGLAEAADASRVAGLACERAYEALHAGDAVPQR